VLVAVSGEFAGVGWVTGGYRKDCRGGVEAEECVKGVLILCFLGDV